MLSSSKERELDQVQARIVRLVLILALCVSRVFGQQQNSTRILDVKVKDLATFEQKYAQRIKCFKMLDTVLTSKWSQEYEKINTTHAYSQGTVYSGQSISKNGYDNVWQEWVMEKNSTSGAIDSCLRILVPEILPMLNQEDIDCLNTAFISHVKAENVHENKFKEYLKKQSEAQPIFRRFVKVNKFFEIMWQNRSLISLNENERKVWEDA